MAATDNHAPPATILVIDIGGSKVKILATGETEPRTYRSGKRFTPTQMVAAVHELVEGWTYEAISIGYPGVVGARGPRSEPGNLGSGWVGFNFAAAFDRPVRIINDAAMQALGNYDGGRMLFLGLGTGLGSALIADRVIVPLELGQLPYPGGPPLDHVLGGAACNGWARGPGGASWARWCRSSWRRSWRITWSWGVAMPDT